MLGSMVPEAARLMALKGAELLIYPTAIGWESSDTDDEKARQLNAWISPNVLMQWQTVFRLSLSTV